MTLLIVSYSFWKIKKNKHRTIKMFYQEKGVFIGFTKKEKIGLNISMPSTAIDFKGYLRSARDITTKVQESNLL